MVEGNNRALEGNQKLVARAGLALAIGAVVGTVALGSLAVCAGVGSRFLPDSTEEAKPLRVIPVSRRDAERQNRPRSGGKSAASGKRAGVTDADEPASSTASTGSDSAKPSSSPEMVIAPTPSPAPKATPSAIDTTVPESITADLTEKIRARLNELDARDGVDGPQRLYVREDGEPITLDLYIGRPSIKMAPYSKVADLASPGEYLSFLFDTIDTPEDAAELANHDFVSFDGSGSSLFAPNASEVIRRGKGDCDDWSVLTSTALERLGERKGKDYHPMILAEFPRGSDGHAVTIFEDGSKLYSIDQNGPKEISAPYKASPLFPPLSQANWVHVVVEGTRSYRMPINGSTLQPAYGFPFSAFVAGETFDRGSFDFSTFVDGWDSYSRGSICFSSDWMEEDCDALVAVRKGQLDQISYKTGPLAWEHFTNGVLDTQQYRSGEVRVVEYENGRKVNEIPF
jgi:hypothetical protein